MCWTTDSDETACGRHTQKQQACTATRPGNRSSQSIEAFLRGNLWRNYATITYTPATTNTYARPIVVTDRMPFYVCNFMMFTVQHRTRRISYIFDMACAHSCSPLVGSRLLLFLLRSSLCVPPASVRSFEVFSQMCSLTAHV